VATLTARLAEAAPAAPDGAAATSFSTTNTQEAGVDEADIVKNDGEFVYVLRGGELIIVDAWPAQDAAVISRTAVEGHPLAMYVEQRRALIFSYVYPDPVPLDPFAVRPLGARAIFIPTSLKLTLLDLADPAAPGVVAETYLDGSYTTSRRIDDRLYVVLNNWLPMPSPWLTIADTGSLVESPDDFMKRIETTPLEEFLPQFRTIEHAAGGPRETTGSLLTDCSAVYKSPSDDWWSMSTVLAFDLSSTALEPLDSATVLGHVNVTYTSAENLYLVQQNWAGDGPVTNIHKVSLGDDVRVEASGEVPGNVLNQFALDEESVFLRIATTTTEIGDDGSWHTANNLYVLAEDGESLNIVGSLEGLAPDERIFAARFLSDHGFLVTFRQIDPLFALDLSNATDPKVIGELHVPGFSRYLHPVDDSHLLSIGREDRSLQVSLFDVSDLHNPIQVDRYFITPDGGWNWSEAEWDHHAFGYYPDFQTLAIPVSGSRPVPGPDSDGDGVADYQTWTYESDLWVLAVDLAAGFTLRGQVDHDSPVQRSLRIGDMLYSIATNTIKVQPVTDPAATVKEIMLQ
jgi:uncharacterized secreted protein with C-terminal beta-propeller domain